MVHSPILDISAPDTINYPKSKNLTFMDCKVNENEAIYVPSFFWHEVTSAPGNEIRKYHDVNAKNGKASPIQFNTAVNFWFEPMFKKEFPCKHCRKTFNYGEYFDVVYRSLTTA